MSAHHYPRRALLVDYGRAALGLGFTALPVVALETAPFVFWLFSSMAGLFGLYFGRTALRHRYRVERTEDGLAESLLTHRTIRWDEVSELKIRYFATRRDQSDGWVQVTVKSPTAKISFDSDISSYDNLLAAIWEALGHRDIKMNDTTVANLSGLGYHRPRRGAEARTAEYAP